MENFRILLMAKILIQLCPSPGVWSLCVFMQISGGLSPPPPPPSLGLPCIHLILRRERERYFLTSCAQHHLDPDLVKLVVYAVLGIWTRPDQNKFALSGLGTDHWFVQNNVLKNKFLLISA